VVEEGVVDWLVERVPKAQDSDIGQSGECEEFFTWKNPCIGFLSDFLPYSTVLWFSPGLRISWIAVFSVDWISNTFVDIFSKYSFFNYGL
jgi:hypothetical protein